MEETVAQLAARIADGLRRRQVAVGRDRLRSMIRRHAVGAVWITDDLSRNTSKKLCVLCRQEDVPLLRGGNAESCSAITGRPGAKVYIVKKSFSGLAHLLRVFTTLRQE